MDLSLVLFAHGDGCLQPFWPDQLLSVGTGDFSRLSRQEPRCKRGLSNGDERDEGKEEGKKTRGSNQLSGGCCRFYLSLLSLATLLCRFPKLSYPLPRAWVAFVRIRQMAPPGQTGRTRKELLLRMRSWQHQPVASRLQSRIEFRRRNIYSRGPSSWACRAAYTARSPFLPAHTTAVRRGYWTEASRRGVDIRPSQRCGERLQS